MIVQTLFLPLKWWRHIWSTITAIRKWRHNCLHTHSLNLHIFHWFKDNKYTWYFMVSNYMLPTIKWFRNIWTLPLLGAVHKWRHQFGIGHSLISVMIQIIKFACQMPPDDPFRQQCRYRHFVKIEVFWTKFENRSKIGISGPNLTILGPISTNLRSVS